jgi:acyl-protein synthetase LuxE
MILVGCRGKPATNKHRMNLKLSSFAARLRESIIAGFQNEDFDALALELFALQFKNNFAYRKICEARRLTPEVVEHWTQIPAVPTAAFKELELTSLAPKERSVVFHSSGTTEQKPSRHFHNAESLAVYEASLWNWFAQNFFANSKFKIQNSKLVFLTPPPDLVPHSSLVHMFETVQRKLGGASVPASRVEFLGKLAADASWTLSFDATLAALSDNSKLKTQNPKLIFGTAFSFVHLLDFLAEKNLQFQLPENSRVMETGGYKNRSRSLPKAELHALITERLGVPRKNIICEYGMSELSSQAYDQEVRSQKSEVRSFHFPPWARVQIISPETNRGVHDGETGLIRVFDLANVFSVAAIQTEDLAVRRGDGFELIGRAQLAEPRGCSLMTA